MEESALSLLSLPALIDLLSFTGENKFGPRPQKYILLHFSGAFFFFYFLWGITPPPPPPGSHDCHQIMIGYFF